MMYPGRFASILVVLGWIVLPLQAAIAPSQVLVVWNSRSADAQAVRDAYLAAHPNIPAVNVVDLNSTTLANRADVSYAEFVTHIRNPLRSYLDQAGGPAAETIVSICLIRGIPHRIKDTDNAMVGDTPLAFGDEFNAGDATCASVDAELVLLWQDLELGEAGGLMDSKSDNLIDNPYHASTADIQAFNRTRIRSGKSFTNAGNVWRPASKGGLTPGDLYLVSRIDGATAASAIDSIARAAQLHVNRKYAWVILDEDATNTFDDDDYANLFGAAPDYENARDHLRAAGFNVRYDNSSQFISSTLVGRPVIAYASYGMNHTPKPAGSYLNGFQFPPGAIFNTVESFNGRALNGLGTLYNQEQVGHFIAAGGTFGIGQVWEPFSFGVADNDVLFNAMLVRGMTWAEAAWTAIPALSWMHVVIGDPLGRVVAVVDQPADFNADARVNHLDFEYLRSCGTGPGVGPPAPACSDADLNGDTHVDAIDFAAYQRCISATAAMLRPTCLAK